MYITERIDGGRILSHYLPEISGGDTAADLYMKGIKGAVRLYVEFLDYILENKLPSGVKQHRSVRYVRNIDWSIQQDIKLRKFEKSGRMRLYRRNEKVVRYYHLGDNDIDKIYPVILDEILRKNK